MKKGQISPQTVFLAAAIAFCLVIVVAFFGAKFHADNNPTPAVQQAGGGCDLGAFENEYNATNAFPKQIVYNKDTYDVLSDYMTGRTLVVKESGCRLEFDSQTAKDAFTYASLSDTLAPQSPTLYRDLATCYGITAGSRPICSATTATKQAINGQVVSAAVDNEGATVAISRRLAPNGWREEMASSTQGVIRIVKDIKGETELAVAFEVADTTSCFLKDSIGVAIYDYSLTVGDQLWYMIHARNTYTGMDADMTTINTGLNDLMARPDLGSLLSNVFANPLGGKNCGYNAGMAYGPQLLAINTQIAQSRSYGDGAGEQYIDYITPIRVNAEITRNDAISTARPAEMYTLWGTVKGLFFITKIGDNLNARGHQDRAESAYQKGLFLTADKEYAGLVESKGKWDLRELGDLVIALVFWAFVALIFVITGGFGLWSMFHS